MMATPTVIPRIRDHSTADFEEAVLAVLHEADDAEEHTVSQTRISFKTAAYLRPDIYEGKWPGSQWHAKGRRACNALETQGKIVMVKRGHREEPVWALAKVAREMEEERRRVAEEQREIEKRCQQIIKAFRDLHIPVSRPSGNPRVVVISLGAAEQILAKLDQPRVS
jgi:hypothetical protein